MNFSTENSYSIYVPRVIDLCRSDLTISRLCRIFDSVGIVERVDLTPINSQQGFSRNSADPNSRFQSAFIHFKYLYDCDLSKDIFVCLESGAAYKWQISQVEYLILKKNYNPIPTTLMNNSQIVENCRLLENTVAENAKKLSEQIEKVASLEKIIQEQSQSIYRLQETLYQVIGYSFDQSNNEGDIFSLVNYMKHGKHCDTRWLMNNEDDGTKEFLVKTIKEQKLKFEQEKGIFCFAGENDEELSCDSRSSTSSSMPSLVSITSEEYNETELAEKSSTNSSLTSRSTLSSQRIRNSYDLCGNN